MTDYTDLTVDAKLAKAQWLADSLAGQLTILGGDAFELAMELSELISVIADAVWDMED